MTWTQEEADQVAGIEQSILNLQQSMQEGDQARLAAIEANLQSVTDNTAKLDKLIKGGELMYFQCLHSGKFYPPDYVKQWGRLYGIGLGRDVVSECLDTAYDVEPSLYKIRSVSQIMHPCFVSRAPMDVAFLVSPPAPSDLLIPAYKDRLGDKRGLLMRDNQLKNPQNRIRAYLAKADAMLAMEVPQ